MIPREGGNRFSGAGFLAWSDGAWQADNLTQRSQSPGAVGGRQDRQNLRLQLLRRRSASSRTSCGSSHRRASGAWIRRSPTSSMRRPACRSPSPSRSASRGRSRASKVIDDQQITSGMVRLTWQMSSKNKLGAYYDRLYKTRGHDMLAGTDPATASFKWRSPVYYTTQIKWTSTISSKLLLEAGYGSNVNVTVQTLQDGDRTAARHGGVVRGRVAARSRSRYVVGRHGQHSDVRADEVLPDERPRRTSLVHTTSRSGFSTAPAGLRPGRMPRPICNRTTAPAFPTRSSFAIRRSAIATR